MGGGRTECGKRADGAAVHSALSSGDKAIPYAKPSFSNSFPVRSDAPRRTGPAPNTDPASGPQGAARHGAPIRPAEFSTRFSVFLQAPRSRGNYSTDGLAPLQCENGRRGSRGLPARRCGGLDARTVVSNATTGPCWCVPRSPHALPPVTLPPPALPRNRRPRDGVRRRAVRQIFDFALDFAGICRFTYHPCSPSPSFPRDLA